MGLTNWQLFFQDLQNAVTDQPLLSDEVLTIARVVGELFIQVDSGDSVYAETVRGDFPRVLWRLNDQVGYLQTVFSDGAVNIWDFGYNAKDLTGTSRLGSVHSGVVFGQSGPIANTMNVAAFS